MNDGPEWFVQKRYGYGATPVAWQGWAITLVYSAIVIATAIVLPNKPAASLAIIVPSTAVLLFIVLKTTRGGWRWRWGKKD
jgi:hypothetical protein